MKQRYVYEEQSKSMYMKQKYEAAASEQTSAKRQHEVVVQVRNSSIMSRKNYEYDYCLVAWRSSMSMMEQ